MNMSRAPLIVVSLLLLLILMACGTEEVNTLRSAVWDQSLWNEATWQ